MDFNASPRASVGAEYELLLLDAGTLDLADRIDDLLQACLDRRHVTAEYFQPTVEIVSQVCPNIPSLEQHLLEQLAMLQTAASRVGLRLAGFGTHPFSKRQIAISSGERYQSLRATTGNVNHLQVTYGLHIHVGMQSGEQAITVMNRLRPYLPLLLALSANSPYWRGLDTGFASYRQRMLLTLPAFGLPPRFADWPSFAHMAETAQRAGIFPSLKDMHWDLRPRPDFGTLEIRVMDSQSSVEATTALAAACLALVEFLKVADPDQVHVPELPVWMEAENHYRASLAGLDGLCIVGCQGEQRRFRELALDVLNTLAPIAVQLDALEQLQRAVALLIDDSPAARQRRLRRKSGSLWRMVAQVAAELAAEARATTGHAPLLPPSPHNRRPGQSLR